MSFGRLWLFLSVALPTLAALAAPMSTIDLAYQVRAGQLMLETGGLLRTDPFTFTAGGQPWLDQQWLAQIFLAAIHDLGGWPLLTIAHGALVGSVFGLLVAACRARGASPRVAAWLALAAFLVAAPALALRPQLVGLTLMAVELLLLARQGPRLVWLVPVVAALWANAHGSFVLAPALVVLAWVGERSHGRLLPVAAVTAAATLVNPFGVDVWAYAAGLTTNPQITRLVTEWQRTSPLTEAGALFYLSVVAVAAIAWWRRRALNAGEWLGLLAFGALGAYAERGVAWWALAAAWLVARPLVGAMGAAARPERPRAVNAAIARVVVLVAVALLPWPYRSVTGGSLPLLADAPGGIAAAVRSLATPDDRLLAAQSWASWLELEAPGIPVLVDSRVEVGPVDAWNDYLLVSAAGPGWQEILDQRRVTVLAVSAADQPALLAAAAAEPGWRAAYRDRDGAVFVRA